MLAGGMRCLGQRHCTANSMSIIFVSIPLAHQVPQGWCRRAQMDAYTCSGFCHKRGTNLLFDSEEGIASSLKVACCKHSPEKCPSKEWSELCICGITSQNVQECSGPIEVQNHRRWSLYRWFMGQTLRNAAIKNEITEWIKELLWAMVFKWKVIDFLVWQTLPPLFFRRDQKGRCHFQGSLTDGPGHMTSLVIET